MDYKNAYSYRISDLFFHITDQRRNSPINNTSIATFFHKLLFSKKHDTLNSIKKPHKNL